MAASSSTGRRPARSRARRRQRSVRVSVAVALLVVATAAVVLALPTQDPLALSIAAVLAVALGWAAARMMWTEVLQSRRENATDRAAAAAAYRRLFSERAAEHAEFTTAMTERLAESRMTTRELQGLLVAEQRRAAMAERGRSRTADELTDARSRIAELEAELARREAEEADALASWEAEGGPAERGGVQDLAGFEEGVTATVRAAHADTGDSRTA